MKIKSTLTKLSTMLLLNIGMLTALDSYSQVYCSPTFANGCTNWNNSAITLGTINWSASGTCTDFDFTLLSTNLNAGGTYPMTVTNGSWCGCSVWIDFDKNGTFDSTENLYHAYIAASTQTYSFNIIIPANVTSSTYRMRVIASWGSDGYTPGSGNGWGACGAFQYGNYDDFSLNITGTVGMENLSNSNLPYIEVSPNPATDFITAVMIDRKGDATLQLTDVTGKLIQTYQVRNDKEVLDVSSLSKGIYFLNYKDALHSQCIRLMK